MQRSPRATLPHDDHRDASLSATGSVLTVALQLRRGFLVATIAATVGVLVALLAYFYRGAELMQLNGTNMTQEDRDDLLDKYNGYTGTLASAFGRPLELVIAMTTQLLVLQFLTRWLLQPEPTWHVGAVAVLVSAVFGFFLNNGFNALNVQLRDVGVHVKIRSSDLSALVTSNAQLDSTAATTNVTAFFAETQRNNALANTVLRSLVLPKMPNALPKCLFNFDIRTVEDSVSFGVPQRDWMRAMLPDAVVAKTLRVMVNATDKDANQNVTSADLPMNASRAADLLLTAAIISGTYIPWGRRTNTMAWGAYIPASALEKRGDGDTLPTGIASGLLPPDEMASEITRREWLLRSSTIPSFLKALPMLGSNISRNNVEIEFAHATLSPSISLDAVTLRVQVDPKLLMTKSATTNATRMLEVPCGPWAKICAVPRLDEDTPMAVHVFAACANSDGSETLQSLPLNGSRYMNDFEIQCPRMSNTSLLIVSTGKRLASDAIVGSKYGPVAVNARKFYSLTVARLAWQTQDLAKAYNATCASQDCHGLDFALSNGKRLLLGASALPLETLSPVRYNYIFNETALRPLRLVTIVEPPTKSTADSFSEYVYGDLLLPHNVGDFALRMERATGECRYSHEDRQQLVLNNHMYMESTLQPAYTAAMFFLFQNAQERAMLPRQTEQSLQTLAFDGNEPILSLWVSIPTSNAVLTGMGCGLLVVGLLAALCWSRCTSQFSGDGDTLHAISTPHVIARVMLDDNAFPPSVVHRRVIHDPTGTVSSQDKRASRTENFYIDELRLKHREGNTDQTMSTA